MLEIKPAIDTKIGLHDLKTALKESGGDFFLGRILLLGVVVAMTRAFALVSLLELLLCLLFISSPRLRTAFTGTLKDPRILLLLGFWLWVAIATLWGTASLVERLAEWWSWRKLILVPFTMVLFQDRCLKVLFMSLTIAVCAIYMVFSWLGYFDFVTLDRPPSQLLENHATQGVLFSGAALFSLLVAFKTQCSLLIRILLCLCSLGFILNILIMLTGRSGYLSLIAVCFAFGLAVFGSRSLLKGGILAVVALLALLVFETPRERMYQAFEEAATAYESDVSMTSLGVRVVMWNNTLQMIMKKPLLGSGSGSYEYDYREIVRYTEGWRGLGTDNPHQQYLHIAAEQGLIGLGLFLALLYAWLKPLLRNDDMFALAAQGVLLGCALNGLANGHFSSFVEGRFVWLVLAAMANITTIKNNVMKN